LSLLSIQAFADRETRPWKEVCNFGRELHRATKEKQGTTDRQGRENRNRARRHRERFSSMGTTKANYSET